MVFIYKSIFFCILLFVFLSLNVTVSHAANAIFVAPNGHDTSGDGSITAPFRSIQHAINISSHGDEVLVRKGTYHELMTIQDRSTDSYLHLTIRPYKNEKVIIDGSKRDTASSKRAAFTIENSSHIKIIGFEIRNISTNRDDFYPAGILVLGESNNIQLLNNKIHHIANYHEDGNAHGILVYGNSVTPIEHLLIRNNTLHHLTLGSSESLTLSGNVSNFIIDRNTLYKNNNIGIDVAGFYGACLDIGCIDYARNGIISNNTVIEHSSRENSAYEGDDSAPGIYVDGGKHIKIFNNYIANNNYGISIGSENNKQTSAYITVRNNTIQNNDKAGLVIGGSNQSLNGSASHIVINNNNFVANDTMQDGYYEITLQQNIQHLSLNKNTYKICYMNRYINNRSKTNLSFTQSQETLRLSFSRCDECKRFRRNYYESINNRWLWFYWLTCS